MSLFQINLQPVDKLVKYMLDISMGMHYIAAKGLIHRVSATNAESLTMSSTSSTGSCSTQHHGGEE
jgi:hypothetical protein